MKWDSLPRPMVLMDIMLTEDSAIAERVLMRLGVGRLGLWGRGVASSW